MKKIEMYAKIYNSIKKKAIMCKKNRQKLANVYKSM